MRTDTTTKAAGLYIHVPFCVSKCAYCNFYSVTTLDLIPSYLAAVKREMSFYRERFTAVDTVYLGGGTPSILTGMQLDDLMGIIHETFSVAPGAEITIEANPGDCSPDFLGTLRAAGFNRISIGVQSFDDTLLSFLGRRHSESDAINAVMNSRRAGFANIGLDLIYALPGQNMDHWTATITKALSFEPEHLSCYELTIEPNTPLGKQFSAGTLTVPPEDRQFDFFMTTSELLEASGYVHYEVSNFARGWDHVSRHNMKYWRHVPYLGIGPAAHSFLGNQRWWNHRSLHHYLSDIGHGNPPVSDIEQLGSDELMTEAIFLGMRTREGIDLDDFYRRFNRNLMEEKGKALKDFELQGLITIGRGNVAPTRRGLALADTLALI